MPSLNESLLDERLAQLERARIWSPRVISKLEAFIRTADDYTLFRVDPIQYATEKGMDENEAIDLFLHAAKGNLFDLEWNLICACCGQVFISLRGMSNLHGHFICNVCRMENNSQLDDFIQVSFTIAPTIREIIFHTPYKLSAHEYFYRYRLARSVYKMPEHVAIDEFLERYVLALNYLEPGQAMSADVKMTPGLVYGGDLLHGTVFTFFASLSTDGIEPPSVHVKLGLPDIEVNEPQTHPQVIEVTAHRGQQRFELTHFAELPTGDSQWQIVNNLNERACVWIADLPSDILETWLEMPPFLSGKRLLTTQTFRNLYRSEVIDNNEGLGVRDLTFLFTDLKGSTAMYDKLGDLKAYHLVRQHFDALNQVIVKHSGAIVKTIGDAVMATFCTPLEGIQAGLEILGAIDEFNHGRTEQLILKIGVHTGNSIAVTLNERLDYFGQTVNIAARVQQQAQANEVYISQDVYSYPGVTDFLGQFTVTSAQVNVKGVSSMLQLYKITSQKSKAEQTMT